MRKIEGATRASFFFKKKKKKAHTIKVAGIAPITELTEEAKASITKANSTPIYIYDNEKLVYRAPPPIHALYIIFDASKSPLIKLTSRRRLLSVANKNALRAIFIAEDFARLRPPTLSREAHFL